MQINTRILNGYIIRGIKRGKISLAQVVDPPSFALLAGRSNVGPVQGISLGMAVGNRDEVYPPGTIATYEGKESVGDTSISRTVWVGLKPAGGALARQVINRSQIQISSGLMSDGQLSAGIAVDWNNHQNLDDLTKFTDASPVTLSGAIRTQYLSALPISVVDGTIISGQAPASYFAYNSFTISESQLPAGWQFFPRRLRPWQDYTDTVDELQVVRYDEPSNFGFVAAPSGPPGTSGVDKFCLTAGCDNQPKTLFRESSDGVPVYARYGQKGLMVALGSLDRAAFSGKDVAATLDSLRVFTPDDLPAAVRPFPEIRLPANDFGRPDIKNLGYFYFPLPLRTTNGFITFSLYYAVQQVNSVQSYGIYGIVAVLDSGNLISVNSDWYNTGISGTPTPAIPESSPDFFVYPHIVGGVSVGGMDSSGNPTHTAQCLVWEYLAGRFGDDPPHGVRWVIYSTQSGAPTRIVLTGDDCGPLFGQMMASPPWLSHGIPSGYTASPWNWFYPGDVGRADTEHQLSAVYDCGGGRLVTAAIAYPWPDAEIFGSVDTNLVVAEHDIRCMVIDLSVTASGTTGTVKLRGSIAARTSVTSKCIITVVQPYVPAVNGKPAVEAVLLASVVEHKYGNWGDGKTYLSMDGGDNWREYITDIGGQSGTFWAGNSLYLFDPLKPFIEASL
ncbi:hypothetical protein ACVBEG_03215 [Pseudomonas sp. GG8]